MAEQKTIVEKRLFRVFVMPCCSRILEWIDPRLPSHCPECGELVVIDLQFYGHAHTLKRMKATIQLKEDV